MLFDSNDSNWLHPLVDTSRFFFNKNVHAPNLQVSPAHDFFGFFELQMLLIPNTFVLSMFNRVIIYKKVSEKKSIILSTSLLVKNCSILFTVCSKFSETSVSSRSSFVKFSFSLMNICKTE